MLIDLSEVPVKQVEKLVHVLGWPEKLLASWWPRLLFDERMDLGWGPSVHMCSTHNDSTLLCCMLSELLKIDDDEPVVLERLHAILVDVGTGERSPRVKGRNNQGDVQEGWPVQLQQLQGNLAATITRRQGAPRDQFNLLA